MQKLNPTLAAIFLVAIVMGCQSPASLGESLQNLASSTPVAELLLPPSDVEKSSPDSDKVSEEKGNIPQHRSIDELLLFHPSKYPKGNWQPEDLEFEDAWFEASDGTKLHGWYCPAPQPRGVVLFLHGNAGNVAGWSNYARLLQTKLKVTTLLLDYRGFGRSEGTPTVPGVLADARAARADLARRAGVQEAEVVLMGRSLGGAVAVQLAAESPCRGLVIESSFSSLKEVARVHFPKLAWIVPQDRLDSTAAIKQHKGPLLISHGDADRTIPYSHGEALFAAANEPKSMFRVPNGDHNDPPAVDYILLLNQFFAKLP